ncbi:MAG: hypothetical protein AB7T32_06765 [Dehalococcoidia bacterium]
MNAANEFEALVVTRARNEAVERNRPWLLSEPTVVEERRRTGIDLFFHNIGIYIEKNRVEPSDLM